MKLVVFFLIVLAVLCIINFLFTNTFNLWFLIVTPIATTILFYFFLRIMKKKAKNEQPT